MNNYPDKCIEYLERREIKLIGPTDLSDVIFEGRLRCYCLEANFNNKFLIGIGADKNEFMAASKCLSELIEGVIINSLPEKNDGIVMGTAFHPDPVIARKFSLNELLERTTLLALTSSENFKIFVRKMDCPQINFLSDLFPHFTINHFQVEFFRNHPVSVVELYDGKHAADGFSLCLDSIDKAFERAFLEAYRRIKVFNYLSKDTAKLPSYGQLANDCGASADFYFIDISLLKISNKINRINELGVFSLHHFENLPAITRKFIPPLNVESFLNTQPGGSSGNL